MGVSISEAVKPQYRIDRLEGSLVMVWGGVSTVPTDDRTYMIHCSSKFFFFYFVDAIYLLRYEQFRQLIYSSSNQAGMIPRA